MIYYYITILLYYYIIILLYLRHSRLQLHKIIVFVFKIKQDIFFHNDLFDFLICLLYISFILR